jgi:hypothetical protein
MSSLHFLSSMRPVDQYDLTAQYSGKVLQIDIGNIEISTRNLYFESSPKYRSRDEAPNLVPMVW